MADENIEDAIVMLGGAIQSILDALDEIDGVLATDLQENIRNAATDLSDAMKSVSEG